MRERNEDELPAPNGVAVAACVVAMATLVPVALHQTGLMKRLPDPPGDMFASEDIVQSQAAHPFGVPDSLPGLASYGTTMVLLLLAREKPGARKLLATKLALDGSLAAFNMARQVVSFRKLCSWCTGTALATGVMVMASRKLIRGGLHKR